MAHPAIEELGQFFAYDHLPPHLAAVSKPFADLASALRQVLPDSAEFTVCLRELLEAKDCAVRAAVAAAAQRDGS